MNDSPSVIYESQAYIYWTLDLQDQRGFSATYHICNGLFNSAVWYKHNGNIHYSINTCFIHKSTCRVETCHICQSSTLLLTQKYLLLTSHLALTAMASVLTFLSPCSGALPRVTARCCRLHVTSRQQRRVCFMPCEHHTLHTHFTKLTVQSTTHSATQWQWLLLLPVLPHINTYSPYTWRIIHTDKL